MKKVFIVLWLLKFSMTSFAQTFGVVKQYSGVIGKAPVTATIKIIDTTIGGSYYYTKVGEPIYLNGLIHDGKTEIKEVTEDSVTGGFTGTIAADYSSMKGMWQGGGKSFSYEFHSATPPGSAELEVVSKDFRYLWRKNSKGDTLGPRMSSSFCYVKEFEKPEVKRKINEALLATDLKADASENELREAATDQMEDDFSSLTDDFDTAFATITDDDKKWMEENPFIYQWEQQSSWEVLFNEQYLLTVRALYYEFTGGAHGNYGYTNLVFNLKDGNQITLDDLFKQGYQKQLQQIALMQLERQYKAPSVDALNKQGFFLENGFELNDNFFIQKNGIGFTYNPYEIAAYALGAVDILIPWASLQTWLKPDGPLAWAIKK